MKSARGKYNKAKDAPFFARKLLQQLLNVEDYLEMTGDMGEIYKEMRASESKIKAWFWYWWQVMKSLPTLCIDTTKRSFGMFKNYIKLALRHLVKNKSFSFINISGLAVGIAASILIMLFVYNVLTFDSFHDNADDIYFVYRDRATPDGPLRVWDTWTPLLPALINDFPAIKDGIRTFDIGQWVAYEDKRFRERIFYADASILSVFTFPLETGDNDTALQQKNSVVISKEMATKYFGTEGAIGKIFVIGDVSYKVTGVLADIPVNSSFTFDFLAPMSNALEFQFVMPESWNSSFMFTYVLLQNGTDPRSLEKQFPEFVDKYLGAGAEEKSDLKLMPMTSFNDELNDTNSGAYILLTIALSILVIASINFMNLTTSRSINRAREIGMRKVFGAVKQRLITQFLTESIITSFLALVFGVAIARFFLSTFNDLIGMQLPFNLSSNLPLLAAFGALGLGVGVLSGIYPSFVLAGFRPSETIRGSFKNKPSGVNLRNILVIAQYVMSIVLILGSLSVYRQVEFLKYHDLSFDKENIAVVPISLSNFRNPESAQSRLETFKNILESSSHVVSVSTSQAIPGRYSGNYTLLRPEGWNYPTPLDWRFTGVDADYFTTYNIEFIEGRNFSEELQTDRRGIIINEAARNMIGWESAVGKKINFGRDDFEIIGVTRDFNYQSLRNAVEPILHLYRGEDVQNYRFISVKIKPGSVPEVIDLLRTNWDVLEPAVEFSYSFVDENFASMYTQDENAGRIVAFSSLLAIIIASLGLLGLASFAIAQKRKELGVRKVLGASTNTLTYLLVKSFTRPVVLATLIAWPLAFYLIDLWLQTYPYRVSQSAVDYVSASFLAIAIALLTILYQALKAGMVNPVHTLRGE